MKRLSPVVHRRAGSGMVRRPRTRTEAAIELVRAEFERERLERDVAILSRRVVVSTAARLAAVRKSRKLRGLLDLDEGTDA